MTPQELKNSILQLAIQGKLVEQRANEGTAAELLEKIFAAKNAEGAKGRGEKSHAKSAKSAKVGSCVSCEEIPDDEKPFEIPESWEWVRLGEVVFNHGQKKPTEDFSYVDIGSIDNKYQRLSDTENIVKPEKASPRARKIIQKGDILYSTVRPYLHNICIVDREFSREPIASTGFAVMACSDCLDNKFLFYFLLSPDFDRYANSTENAKGVAYPAISDKRLYNATIPLPPLAEQKRIVAKIEELMPLVDCYEKAWSRLEEFNKRFPVDMQKSLLQMAIQGKLVEQRADEGTAAELLEKILAEKSAEGRGRNLTHIPRAKRVCEADALAGVSRGVRGGGEDEGISNLPKAAKSRPEKFSATSIPSTLSALSASPREEIPDDEKPFEIPESWEWYRIGDLFNIVNGFTPLKSNLEFWSNGDIPWFTIEDVRRQGRFIYSTEKFITQKALTKNTERVVPPDTVLLCCTASVGEYAYTKIPLTTNQQFNAFVVKKDYQNYIYPLYVFEYVKTLKNNLIDRAGKTTFNFVSVGKLSKMLIPLPPLAEQKRIVAKLEELLPLCERLK